MHHLRACIGCPSPFQLLRHYGLRFCSARLANYAYSDGGFVEQASGTKTACSARPARLPRDWFRSPPSKRCNESAL